MKRYGYRYFLLVPADKRKFEVYLDSVKVLPISDIDGLQVISLAHILQS